MKKNDILTLVVAGIIAAVFSTFLSMLVFTGGDNRQQKVDEVEVITASFPLPKDDEVLKGVFNESAIDPTQLIRIGDNTNQNPFAGASQ